MIAVSTLHPEARAGGSHATIPLVGSVSLFFQGGRIGCLLIHGFTGAPIEMRPMGESWQNTT